MTLSEGAIITLKRMIEEGYLFKSEIADQGKDVFTELEAAGYITNKFGESYPKVEVDIGKVGAYFTKHEGYKYLVSKCLPDVHRPK